MKTKTLLALCLAALTLHAEAAPAPKRAASNDWPQWRGPNRDNVSKETGLLKSWPEGGPKLLWVADEAGIGYAGPAIVGKRLYILGADEEQEYVQAFDTTSGKKLWSTPIGPFYRNRYGSGPRSTPTVDGDYLYALSAQGHLACLKTATGEKQWTVQLAGPRGLGGKVPTWGYSESPLVDGNKVVCSPGGARGTVAALDKKTGKVLWRSKDLTDPCGYSSILTTEVGGIRQYVQQTMKGIAGVAARDGATVWYFAQPKYRVAVIPTPIVHKNYVYGTAGYNAGCSLLELTPTSSGIEAKQVYSPASRKVMDDKHEGVLLFGGYVYGWTDANRGGWICQDFKTGEEVWRSKKLGKGSETCADGHLYCYSENNGTVALVLASPKGWEEKGRFTLPRHTARKREYNNNIWTHPVVANGRLYLRDQELIFCYDVKAK
jgi:outer membrane protein assembly factor BamB